MVVREEFLTAVHEVAETAVPGVVRLERDEQRSANTPDGLSVPHAPVSLIARNLIDGEIPGRCLDPLRKLLHIGGVALVNLNGP